ncbi:hypothetical protein AVEN_65892-1 [Araneus ventricosus]|uniref:Uncharacterized protein n=1 Tax=Araneus ventricosus TaxID=182803 RepID=A0A4Y2IZD1_ARAVE|nr:hypothetical protein AVEN_65892-1 [Araneus ventricosus]
MGVSWKQSNKQVSGDMTLYSRIFRKARRAGNNTNRRQFTNNRNNSTFSTARRQTAYQLALRTTLQWRSRSEDHQHTSPCPSKVLFIVSPTGRDVERFNPLKPTVLCNLVSLKLRPAEVRDERR